MEENSSNNKPIDNLVKFGHDFQNKCIGCLITDQAFVERIYDIIEPDFFESDAHKWIVREIINYFLKYNALPTPDVFKINADRIENQSLKTGVYDALRSIYSIQNISDFKFIKNEFLKFCQNQKMSRAILNSVPLLESGNYDKIYTIIKDAMSAGKEKNIGHNYLDEIDLRMSESARKSIKTNWPLVDDLLDGGLASGELGVVTACAGVGKCVGPDTEIEIEYVEKGYKLEHFEYVSTYIYIDPFNNNDSTEKLELKRTKREKLKIKELFDRLKIPDKENVVKMIDFDLKVKTPSGYKPIKTAFRTEKQKTLTLSFGNIELKTSEKHQLLKVSGSKDEWVYSKDLNIGDRIKTETGFLSLTNKQEGPEEILYDISVEEVHCYYSNGLVSHNSWLLAKIGAEALRQGYTVLHITCELNELYVGKRYDSCFTGIEFRNIRDHVDFVKERLSKLKGQLIIKYFPCSTASTTDIKMHVELLKMRGINVDLLIVDYADILRSQFSNRNSNTYIEQGSIYTELRGVAGELGVPCWTASQSTRGALNEDIIEADKLADSYKKAMIADFIMSLSRRNEDKINNTGRIHIIKNRFGSDGMTFPAKINTNCGVVELFDYRSPEGMALMNGMVSSATEFKDIIKSKMNKNQ